MAQRDRHAAAIEHLNERAEHWLNLGEQVWRDRFARVCVILTIAFLWLTAALVEPAFLLLLVAAAGGLWYRLRHLPVEEPVDDWF
jgi:chromate transport protein ChrA